MNPNFHNQYYQQQQQPQQEQQQQQPNAYYPQNAYQNTGYPPQAAVNAYPQQPVQPYGQQHQPQHQQLHQPQHQQQHQQQQQQANPYGHPGAGAVGAYPQQPHQQLQHQQYGVAAAAGTYPPAQAYGAGGAYPGQQQYQQQAAYPQQSYPGQPHEPASDNSFGGIEARAKAHADSLAQEQQQQLKAHINEFAALSNTDEALQGGGGGDDPPLPPQPPQEDHAPPLPGSDAAPPLPVEPPVPKESVPPLPNTWPQQQQQPPFYGHHGTQMGAGGAPQQLHQQHLPQHMGTHAHSMGKGKGPQSMSILGGMGMKGMKGTGPPPHMGASRGPHWQQGGNPMAANNPYAGGPMGGMAMGMGMNGLPAPMRSPMMPPKPVAHADAKKLFLLPGRKHRKEPLVIVLRGLPGSGKSHIAKLIQSLEKQHSNSTPRTLCFDDYFLVEQETFEIDPDSGRKKKTIEMKWAYDPDSEEAYMKSYMRNFTKTLDKKLHKMVIVDSLNLRIEDVNNFFVESVQRGWDVYIAECTADVSVCAARNVHDWKEPQLEAMKRNWEPTPSHMPQVKFENFWKWVADGKPSAEQEAAVLESNLKEWEEEQAKSKAKTPPDCKSSATSAQRMESAEKDVVVVDGPDGGDGSSSPTGESTASKGRWASDDDDDADDDGNRSPEPASKGRWNSDDDEDDDDADKSPERSKSKGRWGSDDDSSDDEERTKAPVQEESPPPPPPPKREEKPKKRKRRWDTDDRQSSVVNSKDPHAQEGTVRVASGKKKVRWADLEEDSTKKLEAEMGYSLGFEELRKRKEAELAGRAKAKVGKSIVKPTGFQKRAKGERQMKRWSQDGKS